LTLAVITLSNQGARAARRLAEDFPDADVFVHEAVSEPIRAERFASLAEVTRELFPRYRGLVYLAPCGAVVRALAPHLRSKLTDPAVVVVDVGARFTISLLCGHEGGANDLAVAVGNALGAEPVITTTTDALKTIIVGVGCRRGVAAAAIIHAITEALARAAVGLDQVRLLASADVKAHEPGLLLAAQELGVPIRFLASEEIRACSREFQRSDFVAEKMNLPAVAEPAALLAGRRTSLLLPKLICNGVTVALAVESCLWSASDPADR
jgi:cobalt-precorrin 5A hydrolase